MPNAETDRAVIEIHDSPQGALLRVRVIPRGRRSVIDGGRGGALLVRITAAPVDGAANDAVLDLLADELRLPRRAFRIVAGERGRTKRIVVAGVAAETLRACLSDILHR
jgi:hypothetical protein